MNNLNDHEKTTYPLLRSCWNSFKYNQL
jgi:hypothetical protein